MDYKTLYELEVMKNKKFKTDYQGDIKNRELILEENENLKGYLRDTGEVLKRVSEEKEKLNEQNKRLIAETELDNALIDALQKEIDEYKRVLSR